MTTLSSRTYPPIAARKPFIQSALGTLLVLPALTAIALLYALPLARSLVTAFRDSNGAWTTEHIARAFSLYGRDILFSIGVVSASLALITVISIAIAGYLVLGTT
ncbi:hypothetical protein J7J47_19875, partial [Halomonas sp. ISL-60]|nr:hypothetical protein [Halomonas sp. ISL-60]